MALECTRVDGPRVVTRVVEGGRVSNHKGINLPGVAVSVPALSEKDIEDLRWALRLRADLIALSFVRTAADVEDVRRIMDEEGVRLPVLAKIEKPQAVDHLAVLGAGAWGTVLASLLRGAGHDVRLWARRPEQVEAMARAGENAAYLPGVPLPAGLTLTAELGEALAVPGGGPTLPKVIPMGDVAHPDCYTGPVSPWTGGGISALEAERPDMRAHAAPDGTVAILFSDIEDSTVLTEKLGDEQRLRTIIHPSIHEHDISPLLQNLFDGRMQAGACHDNLVAPYQGIAGAELSDAQRRMMLDVAAGYIGWADGAAMPCMRHDATTWPIG